MKLNKIILALASGLALLTACQPKEQEPAKISVNPTALETFEQSAGTKTVTVSSNYVWEAVCDAEWVSVSPAKGESTTGATVTISVLANETSAERSTSVTFYCNNSRLTSASVTVKQKAKEVVIETLTVAEFIKRADTATEYRLVGKISGVSTGSYKGFDLTDATGKIAVAFPENFDEYSSQLATGGTVTMRGKYEYYAEKQQHEMTNGTIESYEKPQEEDPTKVKQITVEEFIQKADPFTTYRLVGTVNTAPDSKYCSFDLKDKTGTIKVYEVKNASDWLDKVKKDGTVTVRGKYQLYTSSAGKTTHEVIDAYIEKFEEAKPAEEKETSKIADIIKDEDGVVYTLKGATVVANYEKGYLVTDGTDHILVYTNAAGNPEEGAKVDAKGTTTTYAGFKQIAGTVTTTVVGVGEVPTVSAEDVTSTFDTFATDKIKKIKYSGTLTVTKGSSTTYYNVIVAGASKKGSISYPSADWGLDAMDGMSVEVEGWFVGVSSNSSGEFNNLMLTACTASGNYFTVSPVEITAKASDTSAQIKVSSNVQWTAQTDNPEFVPDISYSSSSATVTVKFSENAGTQARTAKIKFSTEGDVATKEYVVVITQKAPSAGGYESNVEWTDLKDAYSDKASIEGETYQVLKLGKSKASGSATLVIPTGTKKVSFYAIGWKGTKASLEIKDGDKSLFSGEVKANDGASGNSPYTISSVSSDDQYSFEFGSALTAETKLTIASTNNTRVIVFGINASK